MKNLLFISDTHPMGKSGACVNGNTHHVIINSLKEYNVYSLFICYDKFEGGEKVYWLSASSVKEKIIASIFGRTPTLNNRVFISVLKIIKSKNIDIVYIDNSIMGSLIKMIKKHYPQIKVVAFFHDIETIKMAEEKSVSVFRKICLPLYKRNELLTVQLADRCIVLNQRDRELYQKIFGVDTKYLAPVAVEEKSNIDFAQVKKKNDKLKLLFVGVDYAPNVNGIRWFLINVAPKIKQDFLLQIVGLNMEKYREEFKAADSRIEVIGTVESLREYYICADAVITPIFEGGGMKIKTAEAFMFGKRLIGSSESLEGYYESVPKEFIGNKVFRCDTPEEFKNAIGILSDLSYVINDKEIIAWAKENFSYNSVYDCYNRVLRFD